MYIVAQPEALKRPYGFKNIYFSHVISAANQAHQPSLAQPVTSGLEAGDACPGLDSGAARLSVTESQLPCLTSVQWIKYKESRCGTDLQNTDSRTSSCINSLLLLAKDVGGGLCKACTLLGTILRVDRREVSVLWCRSAWPVVLGAGNGVLQVAVAAHLSLQCAQP